MSKKYRIRKILNNNVVHATLGFQEVIVIGLGIGFHAKPLDVIDSDKIEKVFELKKEDFVKTTQLIQDIPAEILNDVYRIIESVSLEESITLQGHAYMTLIDHVNFAIDRFKSGQVITNLMNFDLRILYPDEFRFGEKMLQRINETFALDLPEDEIGFMTMHIVNGANTEIKNQSSVLTSSVFDCLNVIRDYYLMSLKPQELATQRIMIHVKMLLQRVMSGRQVDFDEVILYNVFEEFRSAYTCALEIQKYIENRLKSKLNPQELVYLTIHLNRLEMMNQKG